MRPLESDLEDHAPLPLRLDKLLAGPAINAYEPWCIKTFKTCLLAWSYISPPRSNFSVFQAGHLFASIADKLKRVPKISEYMLSVTLEPSAAVLNLLLRHAPLPHGFLHSLMFPLLVDMGSLLV